MAEEFCSPQIAAGPTADLGYCEEICYGDIPADPQLKVCRRRSTSLNLTKDEYSSEEVRKDRMVSDSRHGIRRAGGDIVTEISPTSHADFYEALLGSYWEGAAAIAQTATTVTEADGVLTLTGVGDLTAGLVLTGDLLAVSGSGTALDTRLLQVLTMTGTNATAILLGTQIDAGDYPISLSAGDVTPAPRAGMRNVLRSFTMERAFTDIGSFIQYTGQRVNSAAIDLPATGIATSTFTFAGKDALPISTASIDGVTEISLDATDLTSLTFDAVAGTITAAAGDFVAAGITAGDRILISGDGITDPQNRNPRTVISVTSSVLTVAEAIQSGGPYTTPFTVVRVGLPTYTAAPDDEVMVAVSGAVLYKGRAVGTVTSMNFTIDNQLSGTEVVGQNVLPANLWGNQCVVSGSLTVLFDRGGVGQDIYNDFDQETAGFSLVMSMTSADGQKAVSFVMPRCKVNSGSIGDAIAEGLPVQADFRALKPFADSPEDGDSQIRVIDTTIASFAPAA